MYRYSRFLRFSNWGISDKSFLDKSLQSKIKLNLYK